MCTPLPSNFMFLGKGGCVTFMLSSIRDCINQNKTLGCKSSSGLLNCRKACRGIWQNLSNNETSGFQSCRIDHCLFSHKPSDFNSSLGWDRSFECTWVKFLPNKLFMADGVRKWQETRALEEAFPWLTVSQNRFADIWPLSPSVVGTSKINVVLR